MLAEIQARLDMLQARSGAQVDESSAQLTPLITRLAILEAQQQHAIALLQSRLTEMEDRVGEPHIVSEGLGGKHLDLSRRFEELRQEMILQKQRLDLILSEFCQKKGDEGDSVAK